MQRSNNIYYMNTLSKNENICISDDDLKKTAKVNMVVYSFVHINYNVCYEKVK